MIGDVCLPTLQGDPARSGRVSFRYVDIAGIDRDSKSISGADEIHSIDAPSRARKIIEASDVLVSTVRPNLNAIALVPVHLNGAIASTGFAVLRANRALLDPMYLFYWAQNSQFVEFLVANATGASYPAVTDGTVKSARIPLASPREQSRIVELLDEADRLRRLRREADTKAARILPALFFKMFGDPATNPRGWNIAALRQVADTSSGGTPNTKEEDFYGGGIPWVKSGELSQREVSSTEETISEAGLINSSAKWVEPDAVLIAMYGATVGQVSLLKVRATTNQAVCSIRVKEGLRSRYLVELLRLSKSLLLSKRVGGAQPNISQQIIRDLQIMVPPNELQFEFTERAEHVERLLSHIKVACRHVDLAFERLLRHAFEGQLTTQWREAHMQELMTDMEHQARELGLSTAKVLESLP
jgi:type I restriction enzyme S subunit